MYNFEDWPAEYVAHLAGILSGTITEFSEFDERTAYEFQSHIKVAQAEQEMQELDERIDPDGLGPEGQQAWNAFQKEQELPWEERERQADQERLAYCGWEEF